MKSVKLSISLLLGLVISSGAIANTATLVLPDGTPKMVEGYYSGSLFEAYLSDIDKNIKESRRRALETISIQPLKFKGADRVQRHGVNFRYSQSSGRTLGQAFYSCDRKNDCDWVLKVVTTPHINSLDWAYEHFDSQVAAKSLIARDIKPDDPLRSLGFLLGLERPEDVILDGATEQLYLGSECPVFANILGVDKFGPERARYLLDLVDNNQTIELNENVSGAMFDFEIANKDQPLDQYEFSSNFKISLGGDFGNRLAENLIQATLECKNKA